MKLLFSTSKFKILPLGFSLLLVTLFTCGSDDSTSNTPNENTPIINLNGTIAAFAAIDAGATSAAKTIEVTATDLTANISIKTTNNFEVSLDNSNFSSQKTLSKDIATTETSTIYVRFSPSATAVGNLNGTLSFESSGATTKEVQLSGESISTAEVIHITEDISNFGEVSVGNHSETQTFTVEGANLTTAITLSTTAQFEISLDATNFTNSIEIPTNQVNAETTAYIRFSPTQIGNAAGVLSIENDAVQTTNIALAAVGTPITHNYPTFDSEYLAFDTNNGLYQSASQTFTLHNDLSNIAQIKMFVQIDCPSTGCDDWDRFANVTVFDPDTGKWYEIGRYITPYWTGTQQLARGLEFDVTDFKSLLTGITDLRIYIENWTGKADIVSVDFDYIEGTPDYEYYAVSEIFGYHANSIDGVPYGVAHNFDLEKQITIPSNVESTHLRTIISGWGHAEPVDPDNRPCAEWCYRTHDILIDNTPTFQHNLAPLGCASNPISNQNPGNWQPDRAGWCPGMAVPTRIDNFSNPMTGTSFLVTYDYEDWTNNMNNGNAYYATSTYVVVKSNSPISGLLVID